MATALIQGLPSRALTSIASILVVAFGSLFAPCLVRISLLLSGVVVLRHGHGDRKACLLVLSASIPLTEFAVCFLIR